MDFNITPTNKDIVKSLQHKIDTKTKPIGALGQLEEIALQIGTIQQTITPQLNKPTMLVFAADHGIAKDNVVNAYPQEVTAQMVLNFLNGGAAINVFCKQNDINLKVIDAGVNYNFNQIEGLIDAKIDFGTQNMNHSPALTNEQLNSAIIKGAGLVESEFNNGCNCIGFGEMGIGNTSSAALLMHKFTNISIEDCVGAGTGLNKERIKTKTNVLENILKKYESNTPQEIMQHFGGFEIAMIAGAMLKAAELKMTILVDGFIVTSALLYAHAINKNILDYCIMCHESNEKGHQKMLSFLNKKAALQLGLRLGEGTGVALAFPLINASVNFLNNMASFESAGVSNA